MDSDGIAKLTEFRLKELETKYEKLESKIDRVTWLGFVTLLTIIGSVAERLVEHYGAH